jgi:TonB family protein
VASVTATACPECGAELKPGASPAGLCPACLLETALSSDPHDPLDPAHSAALAPGTIVGPFRIVSVIGTGGMGTVYEAYDERLERAIALKVLPPQFLHAGEFARRFEKEARVVAKLDHRNIVPIYASGIDDGTPWMSMRLLAGGNMGMLLRTGRPDPGKALHLLKSIADGLDYAHARGVVHRDIKPTNILLDGADGVCVGDFGLAQMLDGAPALTRTGILTGTPHYMAPEQALGNPADRRSDIYSLGIVAYEIFVGTIPFSADSPVAVLMKHVQEPLPAPPYGLVPPTVMRTIETAAAKDPRDRWPSAGAFVIALEKALDLRPYDVRESRRDALRSRLGWAGAAGVALVAAAAFAWFMAREPAASSPVFAAREGQLNVPRDTPALPPDLTVPPVFTPSTRVRPTQPATQPVASSSHAEPVRPIEVATAPDAPVANTNAQPSISTQPPPAAVEVPPVTNSAASTPSVTPPATPAAADVITPATRIRTVTPTYPDIARAAELEGDVLLQATVGTDGRISNVQVLRAVHPVLDEAARRAVLRYEYTPGRRNGIPEATTVRITVSFKLR